jgi:hypothetical protein
MAKAKKVLAATSKKPDAEKPLSVVDMASLPDDPYCRGFKLNGDRCRRKHSPDTLFCKHHDLAEKAPKMDAPPPTHTGLSV